MSASRCFPPSAESAEVVGFQTGSFEVTNKLSAVRAKPGWTRSSHVRDRFELNARPIEVHASNDTDDICLEEALLWRLAKRLTFDCRQGETFRQVSSNAAIA
jgi:hypothetical protein